MNLDALPHTLLLILAEFSVGSLIAVLIADWRGMVPASFVKLSAWIIVAGAALTLFIALSVGGVELETYELVGGLFAPLRILFAGFLPLAVLYAVLVQRERRVPSFQVGGLAVAAGLAGLTVFAYQVSPPTWGVAGVLLSILLGTLALGFVTEAMILGHWYLVSPKLPAQPLRELTFVLLCVVAVQTVLVIINASIPAREVPETAAALAGSLGSNPAFWLRVGVGLVFPLALAYMAWRSSTERSMMSATGLLYIAVGAVFVGELLARGLLFATGSPV